MERHIKWKKTRHRSVCIKSIYMYIFVYMENSRKIQSELVKMATSGEGAVENWKSGVEERLVFAFTLIIFKTIVCFWFLSYHFFSLKNRFEKIA